MSEQAAATDNTTLMGQQADDAAAANNTTSTEQQVDGAAATSQQAMQSQEQGDKPAGDKPAGDKPAGDKPAGDKPAGDKPPGAPESYEFKAPEGKNFDPSTLGAFSEVAKELNMPQEAAQKVLDKMAPVLEARQQEQFLAANKEWTDATMADKEIGGDKLTENLAVAKKALDTFGTPELRDVLNQSGLGNHPEVIRAFVRAGRAISEDTIVNGQRGASSAKSVADVLYDTKN